MVKSWSTLLVHIAHHKLEHQLCGYGSLIRARAFGRGEFSAVRGRKEVHTPRCHICYPSFGYFVPRTIISVSPSLDQGTPRTPQRVSWYCSRTCQSRPYTILSTRTGARGQLHIRVRLHYRRWINFRRLSPSLQAPPSATPQPCN